ncbi:class C sortase, partial [Bifidobacterium bifidum]
MPASSKTIVRGWGAVLGLEDVRKACDVRRRASFRGRLLSVVSVALVVSGLVVVSVPVMLQSRSAGEQSATSDRLEKTVAGWPYPRAENELKEARAYNRDLASHGQYVLGEANDPFTQTKGSVSDKRYLSMLDAGGGVMGSVTIPKIGVDLPIYHGTSESTLELGAGHLYGSSLPVGGKGTHAVITGHRGLVKALMFTRLDELKKGDSFYIKVMGETLGYKVDRVS